MTVAFSATPTEGDAPLSVQFTDETVEDGDPPAGATYAWDFGDPASGAENSSALQHPAHNYATPGDYTVTLAVTTPRNSKTLTRANLISVSAPPTGPAAQFSASAVEVIAGASVDFTDLSTAGDAAITSWLWDFGDPASGLLNTSTLPNPSHVYAAVGSYTVSLTVTTDIGSDTRTQTNLITVSAPPFLDAIEGLIDPAVSDEDAASAFDAEMLAAVAAEGLEGATAALDSAFAETVDTAEDLQILIDRSEALNSRIFDAGPQPSAKQRKGYDPCRRTTVIHVNGMNVLYPSFVLNVVALQAALGAEPCLADEEIEVRGIYQRSATDAQISFFGGSICPLLSGNLPLSAASVASFCADAGFAFDLLEAGEQFLRDWAQFPDLVPNPAELFDLEAIRSEVERQVVDRTRNVIIVPHSQGNFFTRDVVNMLGSGFGSIGQSVAVVECASPSTEMRRPTTRIDICQDPVPRLSIRFSEADCFPWHVPPIGGPINVASHDFVSSYLNSSTGATARAGILEAICNYHFTLFNDRIEGSSRPIRLSVADVGLSPDGDLADVELSLGGSGFRGIEWIAETADPRIVLSDTEGVLVGDEGSPESTATVTIGTLDFSGAYTAEVWFINSCYPETRVPLLVRVNPAGFTTINFDDITADQPVEVDRYADMGVTITNTIGLRVDALVRDELWNTPSTFLCSSAGPRCGGPIQFDFSPPVNNPGIYVVDDTNVGGHEFFFEVFDADENLIETLRTTEALRFHVFSHENVGRLVFRPSDDFEGLDTLFFTR